MNSPTLSTSMTSGASPLSSAKIPLLFDSAIQYELKKPKTHKVSEKSEEETQIIFEFYTPDDLKELKLKTDYAKEYSAQHEKDVEERIRVATAKAIEDYKKEHPEKNGDGSDGGNKGDADIDKKINDAVAKALEGITGADSELGKSLATFSDFVKTQTEREKTAAKVRVKADLKQHLLNLKANNEACVDDALDDIECITGTCITGTGKLIRFFSISFCRMRKKN